MSRFIFQSYDYDAAAKQATFHYTFDDGRAFTERLSFPAVRETYDEVTLQRALFLAFVLIGTSYYKTFPTREVQLATGDIDAWQADFFNHVFQEGLSQFAFENSLTRDDLAQFIATSDGTSIEDHFAGDGILSLQSGGKDSLLTARLLGKTGRAFSSLYISSSEAYPSIIDELGSDAVYIVQRTLDRDALRDASMAGGLNGHVPVTYIVQSIALIQAILLGKNTILTSIGHEGEEPHEWIGDLPVNHQWSKTWQAEQHFAEYVGRYISPSIRIGSPLRGFSELKIAELFTREAWSQYGHSFSSCNRANYQQGSDNSTLTWCADCPKCANSFLLFAPFLDASELTALFGGRDLFVSPGLIETFKGLLGIGGVMKPFECVGEIDELRAAYKRAQSRGGYAELPFAVPDSTYDIDETFPMQTWAHDMLQ